MKKGKMLRLIPALALYFALLLGMGFSALAEEEETLCVENAWNFVDQSMDVSGGIPQDAVGVLERIRAAGKVRVATEPYFPPQEFIDPSLSGQDQYVGADMELAKAIAERMGVALEIVPMEFTEVLPAVADGICDLAISGLAFTPDRAAMVEMSKGYHFSDSDGSSGILIRTENAGSIASIEDLAEKLIVVQSGSLQEALTAKHVFAYREFRRLASSQLVYAAVEQGRADAATVDIETAKVYIQNNPDSNLMLVPGIQFVLEPQFSGDRVAAKKGELQLMYFVNGVIDELLSQGKYEKWFDDFAEYAARLDL